MKLASNAVGASLGHVAIQHEGRQESPIDEALRRLDGGLYSINLALSELADRLGPVSHEHCPQEASNKAGRPACGYPVGAAIHRAADLVDDYVERIRDMTSRLGV